MKFGFRNANGSINYKLMKEHASRMRLEMTDAEKQLWQILRGNRLGVKFRRQHVVGDYIVDFACLSAGLIIEVDGGYHETEDQMILDKEREMSLRNIGFTIIRFKNEDIFKNFEHVIEIIKQNINTNNCST